MREKILSLDGSPVADGFVIEMVQSEATMPDGETMPSTRIWFLGEKEQAEAAFPLIAAALGSETVPTYLRRGFHPVRPVRKCDSLFAPVMIVVDLSALGGTVGTTYICDSHDDYESWMILTEEILIDINLGGHSDSPQWNAELALAGNGDDEAHYQGEAMKLPLYRGSTKVKKVSGGTNWPEELTFDVH